MTAGANTPPEHREVLCSKCDQPTRVRHFPGRVEGWCRACCRVTLVPIGTSVGSVEGHLRADHAVDSVPAGELDQRALHAAVHDADGSLGHVHPENPWTSARLTTVRTGR